MARVLIIDDEPDVLLLCRVNLEHAGHEVLVAIDGEQGLELARHQRPDVIVLDLMLPTMDGFEVLEDLATAEETRRVPVLVLSAKAAIHDQVRGLRAGASGYMTKPFTPSLLAAGIGLLDRLSPAERDARRIEALDALLAQPMAQPTAEPTA